MAEAMLCPLKTGAVQAQTEFLCKDPVPVDGSCIRRTYEEGIEVAMRQFGQCDREKCALWVLGERWGNRYEGGYLSGCGLILNRK